MIVHVIDPQPVVTPMPSGWDVSGKFHGYNPHPFWGRPEHFIGQDERFKPPLEICNGDYNNIDESFVEKLDGKYVWIIVLKE